MKTGSNSSVCGIRCSCEAFEACPRYMRCPSREEAFYLAGSQCEKYNAKFTVPVWVENEHGYFHCSQCGFAHEERDWTTSVCPSCKSEMSAAVFYHKDSEDD